MNDKDAARLLELLRDYFRHYDPDKMTVRELAQDLADTLPEDMLPDGYRIVTGPHSHADSHS